MPREAISARRALRVRAPPEAVAAVLKEDPPPEVQRELGIEGYAREGPRSWRFTQAGAEVRCRITAEGPGLLELELERAGVRQAQRFAFAPAWPRGTRVRLEVELGEPAPVPRLQGYLDRTLKLVKRRAEARGKG